MAESVIEVQSDVTGAGGEAPRVQRKAAGGGLARSVDVNLSSLCGGPEIVGCWYRIQIRRRFSCMIFEGIILKSYNLMAQTHGTQGVLSFPGWIFACSVMPPYT